MTFFNTRNAGNSWTRWQFTHPVSQLRFGNEQLGLLSIFDSTTKAGRLFKSATGGASWTEIPGAPYLS